MSGSQARLVKLDLSMKDYRLVTHTQHVDELVQLASCCTVGIIQITSQKKVLNLFRSRNYAAFSSQGYLGLGIMQTWLYRTAV